MHPVCFPPVVKEQTTGSNYVGKKYVDDTKNAYNGSMNDAILLQSQLPENTRILHQDSIYTADYRPDRLNLHLDEHDIVYKQGYF